MLLERRMRREFDQHGRCWQVVRFVVREVDDVKIRALGISKMLEGLAQSHRRCVARCRVYG